MFPYFVSFPVSWVTGYCLKNCFCLLSWQTYISGLLRDFPDGGYLFPQPVTARVLIKVLFAGTVGKG